jgi:hypothetical protein
MNYELVDHPKNPVDFDLVCFGESPKAPAAGEKNRVLAFLGNDKRECIVGGKRRCFREDLLRSLDSVFLENRYLHAPPKKRALGPGEAQELVLEQHVRNHELEGKLEERFEQTSLS